MEKLSTSIQITPSPTQCSDPIEKLFDWNAEKPRPISEYIDGNFSQPFNKVAHELRTIGGLGRMNCVKKNRRQILVNRPTQVQKISHTTTKLMPHLNLTDEMKFVACDGKKKLSIQKHVERVKFAENLPKIENVLSTQKTREFNHENPYNLDFAALNDYQQQKSDFENFEKQRRSEIIRRIMETKRLKTKGADEILQEERDKIFGLPAFFDIVERETIMKKIDEDEAELSSTKCTVISKMNKPRIKEIAKLHYEHKREKLRQQLITKKAADEAKEKKMQQCKELEQENLIFRLVDESFPSSECNYNEPNEIKNPSLDITNEINNFARLNAIDDISCGYRIGKDNEAVLRSFHDPFYSEPRGRSNLHIVEKLKNDDEGLTKIQKVDKILNDPKYLNRPPKGKVFSSLKAPCDPNDDKTALFSNEKNKQKNNETTQSAIRNHIQQIELAIKRRNCKKSKVRKTQSTDMNETIRRYQRMNFMGILTMRKKSKIEGIVNEITENSALTCEDKSTSKDKHLNGKITPEGIRLKPKIPAIVEETRDSDNDDKEEIEDVYEQSKVISAFVNAKPRGNDPEKLHIDKSLPWIQNEVNVTRARLQNDLEMNAENRNIAIENDEDKKAHVKCDKEKIKDENLSEMKRSYHKIIATMFHNYSDIKLNNDDSENMTEMQAALSTSTLSSVGTNFTNDSGSCIFVMNEQIPIRKFNMEKKFQNRSLIKTKSQPQMHSEPYYTDNIEVMRQLLKTPDRFHTYRTRSCANIRQRVKVESVDYGDEIIGNKSVLATDIDDSYTKEFYQEHSRTEYRFKRISEMKKLRESFRMKFETYFIMEKFIQDQISEEISIEEMEEIAETLKEYESFLLEYKTSLKRETREKSQQLNFLYAMNDKLLVKRNEIYLQIEPLKTLIIKQGSVFKEYLKYQKFQYMLMPIKWRIKYDHLNRDANGNLEEYQTSIKASEMKGLWDQNHVTAETIMDYIENVYLPTKFENQKTFENVDEFMTAINSIKVKNIKALAKYTYAANKLNKLKKELAISEEENQKLIKFCENSSSSLKTRWKHLVQQVERLKNGVQMIIEKRLHDIFSSNFNNTLTIATDMLYKKIICKTSCGRLGHISTIEKFALIEEKVLAIFTELDKIPNELIVKIEKEVRIKWRKQLRIAENAYKIEQNIENSMIQVVRLLQKPPKKEKRVGKLPRSVLRKRPTKKVKMPPALTPIEEEYAKAFTEFTGDDVDETTIKNVKRMVEKIKHESIPFYIDHMLEKLGCGITKWSPLDTDRILKEEEQMMKFKNLLPEVKKQLHLWEIMREQVKNENIKKTSYLYEKIKK
ncbi:hypothetical protein PVAND_001905 [Polypedilum vanderplanki]|uniref:Uncharacterized protein n=1 Tax=Polypedilum vanderplanki TaxID=319348 RepID=A0A9J6BPV3_POLVA|nr:hypothetical protein PVAND_001905 [Polypedilum vanderplanki]